uniref:aspartyl aminopeptidase n=1 Tax=Helicotheca tamesis TaxID=374047 RepID=A0A7S2H6R7_9STRA
MRTLIHTLAAQSVLIIIYVITSVLALGKNAEMPLLSSVSDDIPLAKKAMSFIDSSPDPYHAVQTSVNMLKEAGFEELSDFQPYAGKICPGGKYYFTRNRSTLIAFAVGDKFQPGNGFKIIGGHTDSPNLRVKPRSKRTSSGCIQLAVECYGGGLWHTWFDRDLGISGRVLVRKENGSIEQKLVKIDRAVLRIPNLAIHLQNSDERAAFKINKENHLCPIIATAATKALTGSDDSDEEMDGWTEYQEPLLLQMIAAELGIEVNSIADFELNLFDTQPASLGGIHSEFIHSARLDNLASCFLAVQSIVEHVLEGGLTNDEDISLIAMFDHEEVGSSSATGAGSPIMGEAVKRISTALNAGDGNSDLYCAALHRSLIVCVDQAHAVHPNYATKHEKGHAPKMNDGMVIKRNQNQRYATNSITSFIIREIARKVKLPPLQDFAVRNDCFCGTTIGPLISAATGIRAIDMGCPQLSMHSIRETMGVRDFSHGLTLFKAFFKHFREVDSSFE